MAAPYWATAAPQKRGQDEERQTAQEQTQTEKAREKQLKKMKNHSTGDL